MIYRTLGRTGLRVSEIGFGCGSVGGLMVRGNHEKQLAAVNHALDLGINYFDTAPQYGDGKSETNLGQVLKRIARPAIVATKVTVGPADVTDTGRAVRSSVETSLKRLGRETVDLLQLHTPVSLERGGTGGRWSVSAADVLGKGGIADALEAVRSQKMVRFLGFTGLGETEALREVVATGRFDVVQAYYNLLNPSAGEEVPPGFGGQDFGRLIGAAARRKMGVVIIRVMAGGALGGPVARSGYAAANVGGALAGGGDYDRDTERARKLGFLTSGGIRSLPEAAIRFALMDQNISTVLVGFSNREQIEMAASCSGAGPIPPPFMEKLKEVWSQDSRAGR
jgi:aryl-alcohol dehydrogenase-like predicted oxidoreductase